MRQYEIVIHGRHNYDTAALAEDTRKVVAEQVRMMGGAPYKRYMFFFHGTNGTGSGGLEHLNSTAMTFGRYAATNKDAYHRFLFVIAHEYFHLWNVKRIRPAILGPFDYSRPQHTRNLYVSEGMTSYYAALSLARSRSRRRCRKTARLSTRSWRTLTRRRPRVSCARAGSARRAARAGKRTWRRLKPCANGDALG